MGHLGGDGLRKEVVYETIIKEETPMNRGCRGAEGKIKLTRQDQVKNARKDAQDGTTKNDVA